MESSSHPGSFLPAATHSRVVDLPALHQAGLYLRLWNKCSINNSPEGYSEATAIPEPSLQRTAPCGAAAPERSEPVPKGSLSAVTPGRWADGQHRVAPLPTPGLSVPAVLWTRWVRPPPGRAARAGMQLRTRGALADAAPHRAELSSCHWGGVVSYLLVGLGLVTPLKGAL